jgi:hypothetical protein
MKVMWSRNLLRTAEGLVFCFCSGSRRKFASRTIAGRDLRVLKAFAAKRLRSPFLWDVVQCRHLPEERVDISQKNSSPYSRRTRRHIPEERIDTSQKNSSPHSRRTRRHIPEERVDTSQKNSSPHTRRTSRYIPEERFATSQKNASLHSRRTRRHVP